MASGAWGSLGGAATALEDEVVVASGYLVASFSKGGQVRQAYGHVFCSCARRWEQTQWVCSRTQLCGAAYGTACKETNATIAS